MKIERKRESERERSEHNMYSILSSIGMKDLLKEDYNEWPQEALMSLS